MAKQAKTIRQLRRERVPHGRNDMTSKNIFKQRKLYKNNYRRLSNTVDFWYKDTLYGRIDRDGNAIYPLESYLKQFKGTDCVLYALSFVVDAYRDFSRRFVTSNVRNPAFLEEPYLTAQNFTAKRAWVSANQLYHDRVEEKYKDFVQVYLSDRQRSYQVRDFDTFLEAFISYLDETGTSAPFTRTGIITGLSCDPKINGLCVEFSLEDHSKDLKKHEGIYNSYFFRNFMNTARFHGFRIDVNAPWRLVADLTSPKMQEYMLRYNLTPDNIFDTCYVKSHVYDLPSIKVYLRQTYNSFVASQPKIRTNNRRTLRRSQIGEDAFAGYTDSFWIKTYARIRHTEILNKYTEREFGLIIREANKIRNSLDMESALMYINKQFLGQLTPTV